ncbi:heavy metal translocating P-type ATPase [Desulfogranum marinum]|uniref:heavy metal translocating P-type ATPase n=1 Tax=Desulfogranum marinum TaxID=453220 RepID=UPI0029C981E3|nr:heavy metal translocating P-type ATPase [Desulfogranum marinum]
MNRENVKKYTISNIDCASCAAKIEGNLQKMEGVDYASLDFANQTLHLQATDLEKVISQIKALEPAAELTPYQLSTAKTTTLPASTNWLNLETLALFSAMILFGTQLTMENRLHSLRFTQLEFILAFTAYLLAGWNVIIGAFKTIKRRLFFDENVLMVIATFGAFAIHAYAEAIGVMIFFKIGELLQDRAVNNSRKSIRSLLAARPNTALLKTPFGLKEVEPDQVQVDNIILVKPGEKIPLDGQVIDGSSQVDNSALTGESVPVRAKIGDTVLAGTIATTGALTIKVSRLFENSSIAKVMELVENATARKARTEKFITTFARYYTPAVVAIAAAVALIPPLFFAASFDEWLYRALVMLVISCPCALVVSIPLGYFAGIGRASRNGILVKGSNYIDALTAVKSVVFDKTGTLTRGVFKVKEIITHATWSERELLEFAAGAEFHSNHPIALSISKAFSDRGGKLDEQHISNHTNYSGQGVSVQYGKHSIIVGNSSILNTKSIPYIKSELDTTEVHVVVDGVYGGYIAIGDELKPDSAEAIVQLRKIGIDHISMLTGDTEKTAGKIAKKLGLNSYQAGLLPEDKVEKFEELVRETAGKGKTVFVGDGINDAPVLARSDVGVAMGGLGSDAAIETADVVLMTDSPLKLVESISIAKKTRHIVWQNIILAFGVKAIFLTLGAIGLATMWEAVFADVGTALLAVANSSRILKD